MCRFPHRPRTLRRTSPTTAGRDLRSAHHADDGGLTNYVKAHIMGQNMSDEPRPLIWRGRSKTDFMMFPQTVQREMGYALFLAQVGERHPTMTKTLKGFGGGTVVEVKESHDGNAYRAVYTVRHADAVYVLHAFQKKSKKG